MLPALIMYRERKINCEMSAGKGEKSRCKSGLLWLSYGQESAESLLWYSFGTCWPHAFIWHLAFPIHCWWWCRTGHTETRGLQSLVSHVSVRSPLCPRGCRPMVLPHRPRPSLSDSPLQRKTQAAVRVETAWEDVKNDHSGKCRVSRCGSSEDRIDNMNVKERDPRVTFWSLGQWLCARWRVHKP